MDLGRRFDYWSAALTALNLIQNKHQNWQDHYPAVVSIIQLEQKNIDTEIDLATEDWMKLDPQTGKLIQILLKCGLDVSLKRNCALAKLIHDLGQLPSVRPVDDSR